MSSVKPTEPAVKARVLRTTCQKRVLLRAVVQLASPTKRLSGEIMSQSVKLSAMFCSRGQYEKTLSRSRFGRTKARKVSHSPHSRRRGDAMVAGRAAADAELTELKAGYRPAARCPG